MDLDYTWVKLLDLYGIVLGPIYGHFWSINVLVELTFNEGTEIPQVLKKYILICVWGEEQTSYGFWNNMRNRSYPYKLSILYDFNYLFLKGFLYHFVVKTSLTILESHNPITLLVTLLWSKQQIRPDAKNNVAPQFLLHHTRAAFRFKHKRVWARNIQIQSPSREFSTR